MLNRPRVSSRGKSKGCLATFIERQTRFYVAIKIENCSASEMYRAIGQLYERYPLPIKGRYLVVNHKDEDPTPSVQIFHGFSLLWDADESMFQC